MRDIHVSRGHGSVWVHVTELTPPTASTSISVRLHATEALDLAKRLRAEGLVLLEEMTLAMVDDD